MIEQFLAIARNTFFESIRQPVVVVLLGIATLMLIVANLTSTFTMSDDQKMLIDIGMATVFVFGALLAAFIASNVLTREIENRTVLTVVSKPVGRPLFVIGKFVGVAMAIIVASLYMCFVFMLVERHGVLQTVRDPNHWPVILFGFAAALIALGVSVWCNYFYGRVFSSTLVCTITPLAGLAYVLSLPFEHDFKAASLADEFDSNLWTALIALIVANLVLTALAVAVSTRLSQIMTVVTTFIVFLLGMLSDWLFGKSMFRPAEERSLRAAIDSGAAAMVEIHQVIPRVKGEPISATREVPVIVNEAYGTITTTEFESLRTGATTLADLGLERAGSGLIWDHLVSGSDRALYLVGKIGHSIFPNFQVLLLNDAITQGHVIPGTYLLKVALYGLLSIIAAMALAVTLFQEREVG